MFAFQLFFNQNLDNIHSQNSTHTENLWPFSFSSTTETLLLPYEFNNISLCGLLLLQTSIIHSVKGGLLHAAFTVLQSCIRSDRTNNCTLVILFQTLIPLSQGSDAFLLDCASSIAFISLYKRQKAMQYRN